MRAGSLFTGIAGLDSAVEQVTGAPTVWHSEIDSGACKVLEHHRPGVPNLGDIRTVDWAAVEPVDILVGGFPCVDISAAGTRSGLIRYGADQNRSGLWAEMARAIDILRPQLVVAENVRGLLSAKTDAHPDLLDCPACVGNANGRTMRALGAVLGDLAAIGYDAAWHGVTASDVGACHQRFRVFIIAWPADTDRQGLAQWQSHTGHPCQEQQAAERGDPDPAGTAVKLLPTPMTVNRTSQKAQTGRPTAGPSRGGPSYGLEDIVAHLLPTPTVQATRHSSESRDRGEHDDANLWTVVGRLLPTPSRAEGTGGPGTSPYREGGMNLRTAVTLLPTPGIDFGIYEPAIRRHEQLLGGPAPEPTEIGPRGGRRLSAEFASWMMNFPPGYVTAPEIGLTRNEALRALGNAVVASQGTYALRYLLDAVSSTAPAPVS